jgi:hypothetical protein
LHENLINSHRPTISSEEDEECEVGERMRMGKTEKVKVKTSLFQAVEAHRVARGQGSHIT